MSDSYVLSIDLGSSSLKAAVVGIDGRIAGTGVRSIPTRRPSAGAAEQDPREIWNAVVDATADAMRSFGGAAGDVIAATCASQYFSLVPVDRSGDAVGNLIMWSDERGAPFCQAVYGEHPEAMGQWLATTGFLPVPSGNDSLSHALYLKHREPQTYERAFKLLEPADFIVARLTGRCVTNPCTGFAQLLIDNRDLTRPAYDGSLIAMSGLEREKLPDIVDVGSCVGTLTTAAAAALGLTATTRVFTAVNDTQAVSIGTGTQMPGRAGINVGTTCQVLGFLDSLRTDPQNNLFAMPSALPGRYNLMAENGLGGRLLQHFLENLAFPSDALSTQAPPDLYAGVAAALANEPPGSGGVLYLPWLTGSNSPEANPAMRSAFLNISIDTTRASMLRAVIEGVTFNLFWQLGHAEPLLGGKLGELRFAGGGAQYDAWAQTVADIMNRPVEQMDDPRHINNRATALLGFAELGLASLDDAARFFPIRRRFEPRNKLRAMYDHLFGQFQDAYGQTRPICEALRELPTGEE
jgi:xylulokinase